MWKITQKENILQIETLQNLSAVQHYLQNIWVIKT